MYFQCPKNKCLNIISLKKVPLEITENFFSQIKLPFSKGVSLLKIILTTENKQLLWLRQQNTPPHHRSQKPSVSFLKAGRIESVFVLFCMILTFVFNARIRTVEELLVSSFLSSQIVADPKREPGES